MVDMTMTCISAANFKIKSLNSGDCGGGAEENDLATCDWLPAQTDVSFHQLLPLRPGSPSPPPTHGPLGLQKSCLEEKRCFHTLVSYLFSAYWYRTALSMVKTNCGKGRKDCTKPITTIAQTDTL